MGRYWQFALELASISISEGENLTPEAYFSLDLEQQDCSDLSSLKEE